LRLSVSVFFVALPAASRTVTVTRYVPRLIVLPPTFLPSVSVFLPAATLAVACATLAYSVHFLFLRSFFVAFGAAFGALMGKLEKGGIDKQFQQQVRDKLQPGTSALFIVFEKVTADKAIAALSKFGGEVVKTSLSDETTAEIQKELHGTS